MTVQTPEMIAKANMNALVRNPYPGRGIMVGSSEDDAHLVQMNWIMGRGKDSRNRVFLKEKCIVRTEIADPSKLLSDEEKKLSGAEQLELIAKKTRNILYTAMDEVDGICVVSNGNHTENIMNGVGHGSRDLMPALSMRGYEDDAPNFTSRIAATGTTQPNHLHFAEFAVLRRSVWGVECDRLHFAYNEVAPGFAYCLTTYQGITADMPSTDPLPAFRGEPYLMPLKGDIDAVLATYWAALNEENKVALAVKFTGLHTGSSTIRTVSKYQKA